MSPEQWDRVSSLFDAALQLADNQRAQFLQANCEDAGIRAEVESLLRNASGGFELLDRPAFVQVALSPGAGSANPGSPLPAGHLIGTYEVLSRIGAGGMGEVYRARDLRLKREVALKILPEIFASDRERMTRFRREAEVLASLNHPNIAQIYGAEDGALVMELVDGKTLSGPLPVRTALMYARQIAEALEYAHEKGVVHRDLKPANIKVTQAGVVKVLDFGLAKAIEPAAALSEPSLSPPEALGTTESGMILGTAGYMSPEQASGQPIDKRTDIWSFGVVLWEMLVGARLFRSESVAHTLAEVLRGEIDFNKLPRNTPSVIRDLLIRCLDRDPTTRLRDLGEARVAIQKYLANPTAASAPKPNRRWTWIAVGAAVLAVAGILAKWAPWRGQSSAPSARFEIQQTASMNFFSGGFPVVSPNGKWVVFPAISSDGVARMWLRALDSVEIRPLEGTESGNDGPPPPIWSPDSRFIAFSYTPGPFAPGQLKKLDISGGPPQTICDVPSAAHGTWSREGVIVFAANNGLLFRVPAAGGVATPITTLDASRHETGHRLPQFLPDDRHFLYLRISSDPEHTGVFAGSIDSKPEDQSLKPVLLIDRQAEYAPSLTGGRGRLLFLRDSTLFAQPFDPARLELSGEPAPVASSVGSFPWVNAGLYSVSQTGVLGYRAGLGYGQLQLTWFDPQGKVLGAFGDKLYERPAISPDGTRVAVIRTDQGRPEDNNIWVLDLVRGTSAKLTNGGWANYPVWSPDGKSIVYASNRLNRSHFDLYLKNADGSGEETLLLKSDQDKTPTSWSPDGRFLLYTTIDPKTQQDLWVLPMQGDRKPFPILATPSQEEQAHFSPDGRWIAYVSTESGSPEVYVRPFAGHETSEIASGGRFLISKDGGQEPRWRGDGRELFYNTTSLQQMAVDIGAGKAFQIGPPRQLFKIPLVSNTPLMGAGDVAADGRRFLYPVLKGNQPSPMIVVTNWQAALARR